MTDLADDNDDDDNYDLDPNRVDPKQQALHAAAIARELREMALGTDYYHYLQSVQPHHRMIWVYAARLLEKVIVGKAIAGSRADNESGTGPSPARG